MRNIKLIILLILAVGSFTCKAEDNDNSTKKERNYIREGNKKYEESKFRDAEVAYKKALEINPASEIAKYNLASSLMKQSGSAQADSPNNPIVQADSLFNDLVQNGQNKKVVENSLYNLGNIAFDKQDYAKSISMYKGALRIDPDNDDARENLRLAQLKLKEQQNQDKNKDKDKNNQDKQDQKDQNKDKNKDQQNKNQNSQDKKDENKNQNQDQQQQPQPQDKQQQKQQQSQGISDANAEKILKTMENEENATRRKVNAMKKKEEEKNASRRRITNQW